MGTSSETLSTPASGLERPHLIWWLQDQERQNFGDYLTEFLWSNLGGEMRLPADGYHLIGSVIADWMVRDDLSKLGKWERGQIVFWCCGLRDQNAPKVETLARSIFCGVRGPLTRDVLQLPKSTVIGDPGLLLPLLYQPRRAERTAGKTICAPHIHERATDDDLRKLTGADVVVRPSIDKSFAALATILDEIASAEFVLAGSLHSAIVACAYGVPFCYFDSGYVDLPFKWRDFSASINIGTFFVDNVAEGRRTYDALIGARLSKPLLFPILAAAPFVVGTQHLLKAALHDSQQIGADRPLETAAFEKLVDLANKGKPILADETASRALANAQLALKTEMGAHAETSRRLEVLRAGGETRDAERTELHQKIAQLSEERLHLARSLDKAHSRPWRPVKQLAQFCLLVLLAILLAPFSSRASARLRRSAQKRDPRRYQALVALPEDACDAPELEAPQTARARSLLTRLVFRRNGQPQQPIRRLFFHASGRPRDILKKCVVFADGRPRGAFKAWMTSPEYLDLPGIVAGRLSKIGNKVFFVDYDFPNPKRDSGSVDTFNYVS